MSDRLQKKAAEVYEFAKLSRYSRGERLIIRLASVAFYALIRLIGKTLRFEDVGYETIEKLEQSGKSPIYAVWHNRVCGGAYRLRNRKIVVITSQSFDGEYIARFLVRFGFGAVRGSSTRGGTGALVEMIRLNRAGIAMAFMVDGPRGPQYVVKPGVLALAKKTGNPILPVSFEFETFWTVKSWDRLRIPKPFSRVRFYCDAPIYVAADAGAEEIEKKRLLLQTKLDELTKLGEQWRKVL